MSNEVMNTVETTDDLFDLSAFDEAYKAAEVKAVPENSGNPPDGTYQVRCRKAEMKKAPKSGDTQLELHFQIVQGAQKNRYLFKNHILSKERPDSVQFLKTDLFHMGLKLASLKELPSAVKAVVDRTFEVVKRTSPKQKTDGGKYYQLYINKAIELPEGAGSEAAASSDDIPF